MAKSAKKSKEPKKNAKPEKETESRALTGMQELFCQYYTTYWNATRAAKEAGYSEKTAMEQGYQLLQNPSVKERVKELTEHSLMEIGITRERVFSELAAIAFVDPLAVYDENGKLKDFKDIDERTRRAIHKVKSYEETVGFGEEKEVIGINRELEFAPKKGALDSIAKCLGIAPDKVEHSGPGGKPIEVKRSPMSDEELEERIKLLQRKQEQE